jgi:hypothetical protein
MFDTGRNSMSDRPVHTWSDAFGTDKSTVDGFALRGADVVLRLFLPIEVSNPPRSISWNEAARLSGAPLGARTTWADLVHRWHPVGPTQLSQPMGTIDQPTVEILLSVLGSTIDVSTIVNFGVWEGYADTVSLLAGPTSDDNTEANDFVTQGGVRTFTASLASLARFTREAGAHLPSVVWSPGHSFAIAQPIYHDSCYISTAHELGEQLLSTPGLDLAVIDRSTPLPSDVAPQ